MVVEDPGGAQAKYDALGEAFAAWDGQVESAEALRIAFGSVGTLRSAPLTEAARAVTQLKRVAAKKTPAALIASFDELAPEHRAMAGALLGDTSNAPTGDGGSRSGERG
jgi:hypothetical protein